jgi:chromosome segregation ATPase
MNYLNFAGVIALAVLCSFQWQTNSRVNLEAQSLQKTTLEQAGKIDEQTRTIKNDAADLDDLRGRLSLSESALADDEATIKQLKAAMDKWIAAVAQRDLALKQASGQIQKLATERNEAILKFNDLAGKYNAIVKQLNDSGDGH